MRSALIVASSSYSDPGLKRLRAPASDADSLAAVLQDPGIGGFDVRTSIDEPAHMVRLAVEEFFADRQPDDVLLLHFSCHGVKDEDGELYFAMADTLLHRLAATAVAADFVNRRMNRSRSRRVVLFLDCCYAGAFERGMTARADRGVGLEAQFGDGRGRAVITASTAMEYAFEGGELADAHEAPPSVFTSALVHGLETGEADRDQDGLIALDELYEHIYDRVRAVTPSQTPSKWTYGIQGELVIARRSRPVSSPAPLPPELVDAMHSPFPAIRAGAVHELGRLLAGRHEGLALAARLTLEQLIEDDSRTVSAAAAGLLGGTKQEPAPPPRLELSATSIDFGSLTLGSDPAERVIHMENRGGGSLNARANTEDDWIRLRTLSNELHVAADTSVTGTRTGVIKVDSDGGSARILVTIHIAIPAPPVMDVTTAAQPSAGRGASMSESWVWGEVEDQEPNRPALGEHDHTTASAEEETATASSTSRTFGYRADFGKISLVAGQIIIASGVLFPADTAGTWPWWTAFALAVLGIVFTFANLMSVAYRSTQLLILLWNLFWLVAFTLGAIEVTGSPRSTVFSVLATFLGVGAFANVLFTIRTALPRTTWAFFAGFFATSQIAAAIAIHTDKTAAWYIAGCTLLASALAGFIMPVTRRYR